MRLRKHFFKNNSLAAHLGGGASSQGGGEQGTGARGSHYLDGSPRSHTIAAKGIVFEVRSGPKHWPFLIPSLNKNSLTDCPYFRSKRTDFTDCFPVLIRAIREIRDNSFLLFSVSVLPVTA